MRNPLMWTLVGFGAYMAAALCLALIAVAVFIHMECKRRKQKRLTTALQQLGLALD
jgi:Flp pilus assembly protein TadB